MGCKATKIGVLMKWLVCASINILLLSVFNSNKLYLLAFFIFKLLNGLYLICKCAHTATIFFFNWSNSKLLCSGMQEYRNMYSI